MTEQETNKYRKDSRLWYERKKEIWKRYANEKNDDVWY